MKRNVLVAVLSLLVVASMMLAACQAAPAPEPTAVPATAVPEPKEPTAEPEPVEEPAEEAAMVPLWNTKLLQAFAAAIDREEIVDRVFEGRNVPAYHMVPSSYPYATEPFLDKYGERDLQMAIDLLTELGYTNIELRVGDGTAGWPEKAPFDAIIGSAAAAKISPALIEQLALGGRLILPVGEFQQNLVLICRTSEGIQRTPLLPVRFVPMQTGTP